MFDHKAGYFFGYAAKIWWQFTAAGLFALSSPLIIGLQVPLSRIIVIGVVALLIGATMKLNYYGLQISKNRIRNYTAIFGIKTGKWQALPNFLKITLTARNVSSWNTPNGISPTFKSNATNYTIALFSDKGHPDFFIQTEDKNVADEKAEQLSELFGIELERI